MIYGTFIFIDFSSFCPCHFVCPILRTLHSKQWLHFTSKSKPSPVSPEMIKTTPNNELTHIAFGFAMSYELLLQQE